MTKQTTCPVSLEELLAYRDHELPTWRRVLVRRHLQRCDLCRQEIQLMTQITEELKTEELQGGENTSQSTLPPVLRSRILSQLPQITESESVKQRTGSNAVSRSRPRLMWLEWSGLAGAFLLLITFSLTMMGRRVSNTFNTAANGLSGGDETTSYSSPSYRSPSYPSPPTNMGSAPPASAPSGAIDATRSRIQESYARQEQLKQRRVTGDAADAVAGSASSSASRGTANLPSALRRVHKEARIGVAVEDVETDSNAVIGMTSSAGGYVVSNTLTTGANNLKTANLSIRVPVKQFDAVMSQISKLGDVKSKNVAGEDVTERFSDAEQAERVLGSELSVKESMLQAALQRETAARKKEKREANYRVPWQQRAEVRQLRIEAAQARARLELLRKISELSSIEVELNEKPAAPQATGFTQELSRTRDEAFASFAVALRVPLNLLIWIVAYSPLWLPLLIFYRFAARHYRRNTSSG
jgi:hypothetical protein